MRFYHRIFFRTYTHTHVVYQIIKYSTTTLISYISERRRDIGDERRAETNGCTNEFVDKNRWSLLTQVEQHDVNNLNEKHMSLCVIVAVVVVWYLWVIIVKVYVYGNVQTMDLLRVNMLFQNRINKKDSCRVCSIVRFKLDSFVAVVCVCVFYEWMKSVVGKSYKRGGDEWKICVFIRTLCRMCKTHTSALFNTTNPTNIKQNNLIKQYLLARANLPLLLLPLFHLFHTLFE